jgi:hypothetical protein
LPDNLSVFVVFLSLSDYMPEYLEIRYDLILPNPHLLISHDHVPILFDVRITSADTTAALTD